jgi:hypothetical protein
MSTTNDGLPDAGRKITVTEAVRLTTNWRAYLAESECDFQAKAFLIPIESIKNLLATNPNAEGVRAYIGLNDADDAMSGKLVLVPVVDGEDIIFLPGSNGDPNAEDDSNIYDRSKQCPPDCPPANELNP